MSTLQQLRTYYANDLHLPYASAPADLATLAADVDAGRTTLDAAIGDVARRSIQTTAVAELSYQFFTGASLRTSGLDYLLSPTGPNPNNLNSAYYQNFNIENRYINFAINLGTVGEGAARFSAAYGSLSLADTLVKSYTEIFGAAPTAQTRATLLSDTAPNGRGGTYTRADYFADIGRDGLNGIGTKAALVGWLLAEAAKEDVGAYAKAYDAFIADLGPDGLARFNVDLLAAYGAPAASTPGATISFAANQSVSPSATDAALRSTAGADTITGANGLDAAHAVAASDGADTITVTGAVAGLIDGGAGNDRITADTLRAPVAVLGVGQNGAILGGAGDDTITVTQTTEAGALIDGGPGDDTATVTTGVLGAVANVEHLFLASIFPTLSLSSVTGAQDVWDVGAGALQSWVNIPAGTVIGVKGASTGRGAFSADFAPGATSADVHLDAVQGYPQGHVTQVGMLGIADATNITVSDVFGPLRVHVDSASSLGQITNLDGNEIDIDGIGALTAAVGTSGRGATAATSTVDASAASQVNLSVATAAYGRTTVILSSGDDTVTVDLQGQGVSTFTLGAGRDVFSAPVSRFVDLHITAGKVDGFATITDFAKGVDHLDLTGGVTAAPVVSAGAASTLEAALTAVSAQVSAGAVVAFEYGGDTWLYHQDATAGANTGDGLVRLVGVTGLTTGAAGGSADIRFG